MESKEILTLPRIVPMQRTIATQLSPISLIETRIEKGFNSSDKFPVTLRQSFSCKSIQVKMPEDNGAKSSLSSVELYKSQDKNVEQNRSKKGEDVKKRITLQILKLLHDLSKNTEHDVAINDEKQAKSNKKMYFQDCKNKLLNNFGTLRRSISDDTCLREDLCVKVHQEDISNKSTDFETKCSITDLKEGTNKEFMNKLKYLTSNSTSVNVSIKDESEKPKRIHESCGNNQIHDDALLYEFNERKRWHKGRPSTFSSSNTKYRKPYATKDVNSNESLGTNQEELRNSIDLDILAFTEKYRLNITTESLYDLREELFDLFAMDLFSISSLNKINRKKDIKNILQKKGFAEYQAICLTDILTEHWEENLLNNNKILKPSNITSDTFIVLSNITHNHSSYVQSKDDNNNIIDCSIKELSQKDIDANVDMYVKKISNEITEWFLNLQLPQILNDNLRQSIIKDLVDDIIDRQKYLELNPTSETSDASELENLKYQIFKFFKTVGAVDLTPVENASDLMKRIRRIPIPIFTPQRKKISEQRQLSQKTELISSNSKILETSNAGASSTTQLNNPFKPCCNKHTCKRNLRRNDSSETTSVKNNTLKEPDLRHQPTTSTRRMSNSKELSYKYTDYDKESDINEIQRNISFKRHLNSPTADAHPYDTNGHFIGGIKIRDENKNIEYSVTSRHSYDTTHDNLSHKDEINKNFTQYLKEWVENIPIPVTNSEEQMNAKTAKIKIFNVIYQCVSKLISEPDKCDDRFLCEDLLDNEIEILLNNLPQSPELNLKKHILKVTLIVKTMDILELLKSSAMAYKHELIETIKGNIPKSNDHQNPKLIELYEDLQILNLVEHFIIFSRYQNEDQIMSEAYRNKLIQCTKDFISELKINHSEALMNIDTNLYLDNILDALKKVPLPTDETLRKETDELLLGIDIGKWLSELPLVENNDFIQQLHKKYLKNSLLKQICKIDKDTCITNSTTENNLKHEVSKFLERVPLQEGKSLDINFMIDDLIKRLKNRSESVGSESKKVGFHDPDYEEFSRNMPFCSSYMVYPRVPKGIDNQHTDIATHRSVDQAISPSDQTYNEHHNSAKPLHDEIKISTSLKEPTFVKKYEDARPINLSQRSRTEPQWYTLQESNKEYPQASSKSHIPKQSSQFDSNRQFHQNNQGHHYNSEEQCNKPAQFSKQFILPQQRFIHDNTNEYTVYREPSISHPNPPKRDSRNKSTFPTGYQNQETSRRMSNQIVDQRFPDSHSQIGMNPKRFDNTSYIRDSIKSNDITCPHHATHHSFSQKKPEENLNQSQLENDNMLDQHGPQMNRSELFNRSTYQDGIRKKIERNRSIEANLESSNRPEHLSYPPSMAIPHGCIPIRIGTKKDYISEERYQDVESDEDDDEEDKIRCRCIEKLWKSKRRPRYCPFDDYDGYPMCISTPYFYPYFY